MARPRLDLGRDGDDVVRAIAVGTYTVTSAARRVGVHRSVIARRMRDLALDVPVKGDVREARRVRRPWSADEAWLTRNIGQGVDYCARRLRRSRRAVAVHAWRLGLDDGRTDLSIAMAADILGVRRETIHRWGVVKASGRVSPKELRRFVIDNPMRVNPKTIGDSWSTFVQLIGGAW